MVPFGSKLANNQQSTHGNQCVLKDVCTLIWISFIIWVLSFQRTPFPVKCVEKCLTQKPFKVSKSRKVQGGKPNFAGWGLCVFLQHVSRYQSKNWHIWSSGLIVSYHKSQKHWLSFSLSNYYYHGYVNYTIKTFFLRSVFEFDRFYLSEN